MFEVSATHPSLPALFDAEIPNSPMLFAILLGHNPGRAFVDDVTHPSQAVIRTNEALVFLSQRAHQGFFDQMLAHLRQISHVGLIWRPAPSPVRPAEATKIIRRLEFPQCGSNSETVAGLQSLLPDGFEIRLIDRSLLERCEWRPMIESACGSLDNFLAHGLGICLMRGNELITEAYAPFWGIREVELGVVTSAAHRGHGYAAITCAHLIQTCRQHGFEPYWSCDADNLASVSLGHKLGFQREREYEMRMYRGTTK
jgi:GNAT superfamily N-acetyltransferase